MANKLLIISHGNFAEGCKSTLDLFMGDMNPYHAISAYIDDVSPQEKLDEFLFNTDKDDTLIICTDLLGGSLNQLVSPLINRPNTYVVAGVNIPILMELAVQSSGRIDSELIRNIVEEGRKNSIVFVNDHIKAMVYNLEDE